MTNVDHWVLSLTLLSSSVHNIPKISDYRFDFLPNVQKTQAHFLTTTALSLFLCLASWTVDGREVVVASTGPSYGKNVKSSCKMVSPFPKICG